MRRLSPVLLTGALALASLGATAAPASAAGNGCNYPPGGSHSVLRGTGPTVIATRGAIVTLSAQAKGPGGRGCTGAVVELIYAPSTGGSYRLYHPTPTTNGVTAGNNGYAQFHVRANTSYRYYFEWHYTSRAAVISAIGKVYVR